MATTYNTLSTQASGATTSTETIDGTTYYVYTYSSSAKTFSNDLIILPTDKLVFDSQTCTFNCNVINCGIFYINSSTCRIKASKNFTNLHGSFYYSNGGTTEFENSVTMRSYDCTIDISYPNRGNFKVETGSTANHYMYKVTTSDGTLFSDLTSGWTGTGTQTIATAMLLTDTNHFSKTDSITTIEETFESFTDGQEFSDGAIINDKNWQINLNDFGSAKIIEESDGNKVLELLKIDIASQKSTLFIPGNDINNKEWTFKFDFTLVSNNDYPADGFSINFGNFNKSINPWNAENGMLLTEASECLSFCVDLYTDKGFKIQENTSGNESNTTQLYSSVMQGSGTVNNGNVEISFNAVTKKISFNTSGLVNNASFTNIDVSDDFINNMGSNNDYNFCISGRTGGQKVNLKIDNIEIDTKSTYKLNSNLTLSNDTYLWIKPGETLTIPGGDDYKELTCPTRACIINNGTINAGESETDYESAKFLIQGNITNTYVINIYHHLDLDLDNTSSNSVYLTLFNSGTINNYYSLFLQGKVINTNSIINKNNSTFVDTSNSNYQLFVNAITPFCFYGFVKIITKDGLKEIKDLRRGDLVLTNDGYQPLSLLVYSPNFREYKGKQQMVKIPKDFFTKNIPNEDIYTTDTHPLSVKVLSEKEDTDFEYLHLFVKELIWLNNDDKKIKYEYLEEEKYMYNLVFDKHYELNIGGIKMLSHHPNHNNGNLRLSNGDEIDPNNRSKKVYADKKGIYFKRITLKKLLKDKPEQMSDKEYIVSLIQF